MEEQLVPKRTNKGSVIWRFFGYREEDVEQVKPICKVCKKTVLTKGSSTTNMLHHLKTHPVQYEESVTLRTSCTPAKTPPPAACQMTLAASFSKTTPYEKTSQRWRDITDAITNFIAQDMMPINTVEKPGFRKLIKTLDPKYEMPGRRHFSEKAIPELYTSERQKLARRLQDVTSFSSTADLWSSRTMEPYLSFTVHFIDNNWELNNACLQTSFFPKDHTAELLAEGLHEVLKAWDLPVNRQVCLTTDNGANIVKAARLNDWVRLQCFGHRLHLAIEKSMKDARIDRAVGVCKKVVSSFSFSWKKRREMAAVQRTLNLPPHQLISESPTRWGSRQHMIERILEQEQAIAQVLAANKSSRHLVPTWQDMDVLDSVNKALKPLVEFTDALSGEGYVTVSFVKPVLHLFHSNILAVQEGDTDLTKSIRATIMDYLMEKFDDVATNDLLDMAGLLDPRFKTAYIDEDRVEVIKSSAIEEMESLSVTGGQPDDPSVAEPHASTEPPKKKTLGSFFKKARAPSTTTSGSSKEQLTTELSTYLQTVDADSESDPLLWWKHEQMFPNLRHLAKKYLCVQATSSPSERVFSTSGNVVTCHRASLKPEAVDRLVFLAQNLKK
ncbi:Zinc finger BED domain-containing protein 1 [Merluccius polli]|uniref:Zinc finger BED domain-containing protein 1 n=1 Tax=Merluccius polli TaxID=89951 RepID=A0AA47MHP9_MERPO|nr:Zinc finger BED domain-containing protein 1 [Merluccius polli]